MRKEKLASLLLALCLLTGCAAPAAESAPSETASAESTHSAEQAAQPQSKEGDGKNTSAVADASQMTTVEDVVADGMTPICADEIKDGEYPVAVDCSSSMFKIAECTLRVADGAMTATLVMTNHAYGYLYPGTAAEAAAAPETDYLTPEVTDGAGTFVLPVEALDAGVDCAAWSRNKELWYDRTLVFRSDSLPLDAFQNVTTVESLGLADGEYTVDVTLVGGSGRASVQSPAVLTVKNGTAQAGIVWSSANYDYMIVDGMRYDAAYAGNHSLFGIPIVAFDRPLAVVADTTAMSQPHEIDYTLTFDSSSIVEAS